MAQLVPIYYDCPEITVLDQELHTYGIVIINRLGTAQKPALENYIGHATPVSVGNGSQDHSNNNQLIHYWLSGRSEQGYDLLDCYINPAVYQGDLPSIRQIIEIAAKQWCIVGKPFRHLAVLLHEFTCAHEIAPVSTPLQLRSQLTLRVSFPKTAPAFSKTPTNDSARFH